MTYTLYAAPISLFSGKARAYLRWKGVAFREVISTPDVMKQVILPQVGWPVIPVLETPDGEIVQDTADIIAAVEARESGPSVWPDGPLQRFVTALLHLYADQWLVLPAMHYRWNHNLDWTFAEFGRVAAPDADAQTQLTIGQKRGQMFRAMVPALGIDPETAPAIEASYLGFLDDFSAHLEQHDYVFGGRPSLADFALYGPLFAHLYRDPASGQLMKARAPQVARWVERLRDGDYGKGEIMAGDKIPQTLLPLLRRHFDEHLDVLLATDALLSETADTALPRVLGQVPFTVAGVTGRTIARPFSLFRLQGALDELAGLSAAERSRAAELLTQTGGAALDGLQLSRRLARRNYRLVAAD